MEDLEAYKLWHVLLGIAGIVLLYYGGTRGVYTFTERLHGWQQCALRSLSLAILLAPSLAGAGHGGVFPAPAWMVALQYASEDLPNGVVRWGLVPIAATWVILFAAMSVALLTSKNKNNKVDSYGKET